MLPSFTPADDPGPDFGALVRRVGLANGPSGNSASGPSGSDAALSDVAAITHGTTCIAVRYADGVVMAGDRRATSGNWISHRTIEKVFPADRYSGVAIAGAAGPAIEMVRLFQLQLEHYEKVEGSHLSLEGKANQLSQMLRNHLPAALSGMAVVPIFAGYDVKRAVGRLFQYDITGGRYEESDYAATGSGSMHAATVTKLGFRPGLGRDETIDLVLHALWQAADEDSATGGPDLIRKIFPVVATITAGGFQRLGDAELEERSRALIASIEERRS